MINIRRATEFDCEQIHTIEEASFTNPWSFEGIKKDIKNEVAYYWIATINSEVVGYVGMWDIAKEGQVTTIAVAEKARGRGVARCLINYMISFAKQTNMTSIFLEVRRSNEVAKSLYEGAGFEMIATRKGYYTKPKEDALIFEWENK